MNENIKVALGDGREKYCNNCSGSCVAQEKVAGTDDQFGVKTTADAPGLG